MATNKTNGIKDRNQTLVEFLCYEQGSTFVAIATQKAERHKLASSYTAQQSGEKLEAIACTALGVAAGVGGIMAGVAGLAVGGLVIAPVAGIALMARVKGEVFAAKEQEFLRLNSDMIEHMAAMEQKGLAPTLKLADIYVSLFAEGAHKGNLVVSKDAFDRALAAHANTHISAGATVSQFAHSMATGTEMKLPEPPPEPEIEYYPEPEEPATTPYRFSPLAAGAIDVSVVSDGVIAQGFDLPPERDSAAELWDVIDRNNSFFVVGSKGAGKGMLVANLLRRKLEQYPNATALVFDPKGDEKEDGYWDHPRMIRKSFRGTRSSSAIWEEEAISFLATAIHMMGQVDVRKGKRLFLVFDELLACKTNLCKEGFAEITRLCSNGISMGDSEGIHAIAITQSMNAGDAFGSEEITKNMCLMAVLRQDEFSRAKKLVKFGKVNTDALSEGEFEALRSASPVNRVMVAGGRFIPTPTLTNYSTWDRDSEQPLAPAAQPSNPAQTFGAQAAIALRTPPIATQKEVAALLIARLQGDRAVLEQVRRLTEIKQERSAFRVMVQALLKSPTKTSFCKLLGVEGGSKFQGYGDVFDWIMED